MVIKGNGGEGKSQIGVVLSRLFGCNMKDGSIGKISENRFARADLEHTLLCVDDDMRMEALRQTNYVKSIWTWSKSLFARLLAFSNGDLQALTARFYVVNLGRCWKWQQKRPRSTHEGRYHCH